MLMITESDIMEYSQCILGARDILFEKTPNEQYRQCPLIDDSTQVVHARNCAGCNGKTVPARMKKSASNSLVRRVERKQMKARDAEKHAERIGIDLDRERNGDTSR